MPLPVDYNGILRRPFVGGKVTTIVGAVVLDDAGESRIIIWDGATDVEVDPITGSIRTISIEHAEIHEGEHFFCGDDDQDVDIGADKYWHVRAPDTPARIHLRFSVTASINGTLFLYENPTLTNNGTPLICYNNDRNNATAPTLIAFSDPTVTAPGTELFPEISGSDGVNPTGRAGGLIQRTDEIILKQNTSYLIGYDTLSNDNRVSILMQFYEE